MDWGIGGIGLLSELQRQKKRLPLLYFSDSGFLPYGKVSASALRKRVLAVAGFLVRQGATHLAVACNAASTVLPALGIRGIAGRIETEGGPIEVTGIIAHAVRQVRASKSRDIGVIGGTRTIRSGIYRKVLATHSRTIRTRVAQPLSAHVEAGDLCSPEVQANVRTILSPLKRVDAILMACTHYPALRPLFERTVPGVILLDPVPRMARWVIDHFATRTSNADTIYLTTGSPPSLRRGADVAFGHRVGIIRRIRADFADQSWIMS
ncbi:MAG: aspartate/glutamate racemase family protein [Deltaproteobacteria bacterium]|nr:aspartate/glutamate racemase family protein [Deltaproteobacteria bacterium]